MTSSVAIAIAIREARTMGAFRDAAALAPESAVTLESLDLTESATIRRLARAGVLVSAPGGYYLDEPAALRFQARRRKRVLVALALVLGGLALWMALGR